jgi:hypothetical protein
MESWPEVMKEVSAIILYEIVPTYRESCFTKALSAWMSLASIKYLEDIQVTFSYS